MSNIFAVMTGFFLVVAAIIVAPHLSWPDARKCALFFIGTGVVCAYLALVVER
tara:strand:- start:41197 stop:41355 length:159 start_codon:yes stop_codon:yes gene_type:complete